MTLKGDLKEFGVTEILQLLERQGKTGVLELGLPEGRVEVYFEDGRIVGALGKGEEYAAQVLDAVEKANLLSHGDRVNLEKQYKKELRGLPEILAAANIMSRQDLEGLLREQVEKTLFPVLSCRSGDFFFDVSRKIGSEWSLEESLAVEPMILEGLRQKDELPELRKKIESGEVVPRRQIVPPEEVQRGARWWLPALLRNRARAQQNPFDEITPDPEIGEENSLSSPEKVVYKLVDGRDNVEAILRVSPLGEFSTCKALLALEERGWIRFDDPRKPAPGDATGERGKTARPKGMSIILGLIVFLIAVSLLTVPRGSLWERRGPKRETLQGYLNHQKWSRVDEAVRLYRIEHGRLPEGLADLSRERLIGEKDLRLWGGRSFVYRVDAPDAYQLMITTGSGEERPAR